MSQTFLKSILQVSDLQASEFYGSAKIVKCLKLALISNFRPMFLNELWADLWTLNVRNTKHDGGFVILLSIQRQIIFIPVEISGAPVPHFGDETLKVLNRAGRKITQRLSFTIFVI